MPRFAANLTMLFCELPFLDRFEAAKAAGFSGIEFLFPYDFEKAALRERLLQHDALPQPNDPSFRNSKKNKEPVPPIGTVLPVVPAA